MRALQYLDKIIHIPFCIPTLSEPKKIDLIDSLLNGSDNSCSKTLNRVKKFLNVSGQLAAEFVAFRCVFSDEE